jgi:hypothetical protein
MAILERADSPIGVEEARLADAVAKAKGELTYESYADALRDVEDVKPVLAAHATGRLFATDQKTSAVDVEQIIKEEIAKAGDPLPPALAQAGPTGIDQRARRILRDKNIDAFDATSYREAVRQAIRDLKNDAKRTV